MELEKSKNYERGEDEVDEWCCDNENKNGSDPIGKNLQDTVTDQDFDELIHRCY